jgi:hypothetical protein
MRNKAIFAILFFVICSLGLLCITLFHFNEKLYIQIEQKDSLIKNNDLRDSIYTEATKEYSEVINKYVNNCSFTVNEKSISTQELLKLVNNTFDKNQELQDSLDAYKEFFNQTQSYKDSLFLYKNLYSLARKRYGINITYKVLNDKYAFYYGITKVDSAMALFPFYKNKIKRDTANNSWTITTQTK